MANAVDRRIPPAAGNLLASIGNTPLFRLERIAEGLPGIEIYAKAEYFNHGGSVKDRPALNMINIGEADGRPVAYSVTFHNFSTFLGRKGMYLEDLYVKQSERRKGYGRALLLHIARLAKERGCGRFEWTVLDWNEPAIRFYEGLGASILHEWKLVRVTGDALTRMAAMR